MSQTRAKALGPHEPLEDSSPDFCQVNGDCSLLRTFLSPFSEVSRMPVYLAQTL